jgi:hypothetical protein
MLLFITHYSDQEEYSDDERVDYSLRKAYLKHVS